MTLSETISGHFEPKDGLLELRIGQTSTGIFLTLADVTERLPSLGAKVSHAGYAIDSYPERDQNGIWRIGFHKK